MYYELTIVLTSISISFLIYFSLIKYFNLDRRIHELEDEIVFDPRHDLNGKELIFVSVVRNVFFFSKL